MIIFTIVIAFGMLIVSVYFQMFRGTLKSLTKLQKGVALIGSGNLDFKIDEHKQDELGDLARAFNQMTSNLKATDENLRENEQLYRILFENTEDGFQLVKPLYDKAGEPYDLLVLKVNNAYEQQTGLKESDIVGRTLKESLSDIEPYWISAYGNVAKTGRSMRFENYNQSTNRWYNVYAFLYAKDQVGALIRDITGRKNLEKQLQEKERMAAIGQTAGMVGHDIRNPLQAITGDLYTLKADIEDLQGENKQYALETIEAISQNISYIGKIVSDLQDYAKLLKPEPVKIDNLCNLIERILLTVDIPSNIEAKLYCDKKLSELSLDTTFLKRILVNLLTNAIQAMPNGGKLIIRTYQKEGKVVIEVEDTGEGIPEEIKPKLFTPLLTTKAKGQGFGLPVIKRYTEAMGGTISFESEVGKGTKFIILLPTNMNLR